MENVVSARRLRKSMLNTTSSYAYVEQRNNENEKKKLTYFTKFLIRSLISSIILFVTIFLVNNYGQKMLENATLKRMYEHYRFNFSKELILNNFEDSVSNINGLMGDIVPKNIRQYIVTSYSSVVKPFILNFDLKALFSSNKDNEVEIYVYNENNLIGVENNLKEEEACVDVTVKLEDIAKIIPAKGVITSRFGEREKIFEELSTNHTGIDIANTLGTDILSSTSGNVVKTKLNDKYYGNYIEINTYGYIFKYAHLSEILVSEGDYVESGCIIGKMGSTGMSTGSHLHFEILVNGKVVDPESVMEFE
ncbi:MAG: M23 family metallopeptidase [Clostridia bacterium]|nr:M23 family metallopeptidase [Clostridia bacterium]